MAEVLNRFEPVTSGQDNPLILEGTVKTGAGQNLKKVYLSVDMTDVSAAGTVYLPSPVAGVISKVYVIIANAITGADSVITTKIGSTAVTGGAVTLTQSGSASGSVFSATPTANNAVVAGDNINFTSDGASSTTSRGTILVEITQS